MHQEDTIAAIATAQGASAIAMVRMSGPEAIKIAGEIFSTTPKRFSHGESLVKFKSHYARHGFLIDPETQEVVDEVVMTCFLAPRSYTGEDLIEITCHGGIIFPKAILALLIRAGARLAGPGEFTSRAFLNGRIDLTQAEAVLDVIQAKTGAQGRRFLSALTGGIGTRIKAVRAQLIALQTRIVAGLDFPEEIGDAPEPEIEATVKAAIDELGQLSATAASGHYLREGVKLAIVGRPNAGKSSLMNQLLRFERAIVTDIPGTTRDSIEEYADINGVPVVLVDTAGIRHTEDQVERIGIEHTKRAVSESDLVLFVIDATIGIQEDEHHIYESLGGRPYFLVFNKIDACPSFKLPSMELFPNRPLAAMQVSAVSGENISELQTRIEAWVLGDETSKETPLLNARQANLCLNAAQSLELVLETVQAGMPQDCLVTDTKAAIDALSELSGETVKEEIISQVFANFCIGK